jgi:predicted XRE-type DNA-binding protein
MREPITRGTDNIFADLGFADAKTHKLKAELVLQLRTTVAERGLTQAQAGALIGISQPEVSRIFRGHFGEVSVERLMGMLTRLGCEIDIVVTPAGRHASFPLIHLDAAQLERRE